MVIFVPVRRLVRPDIDGVVNIGRTGTTIPTTDIAPPSSITVETFTHHLAVTHAMADGMPRLIARQTAMFIATPTGEVWQVFDADATDWIGGGLPRNNPDVLARIF